jgi:hypothetical protein
MSVLYRQVPGIEQPDWNPVVNLQPATEAFPVFLVADSTDLGGIGR